MKITEQIEDRKSQIAEQLERLNSAINTYIREHADPTERNVKMLELLIDSIDRARDLMPPD